MRLLIDVNVLLDCLVLEANGLSRSGRVASEQVIEACDQGVHFGLVAWHTLPIISYYFEKQNSAKDTAAMIDGLLAVFMVPTVGHSDAAAWKLTGLTDFEDALQVVSAIAGIADVIVTRNTTDFTNSTVPVMTPEEFIASFP